jgi:glutamate dehydrogenase (NAD(P)+)
MQVARPETAALGGELEQTAGGGAEPGVDVRFGHGRKPPRRVAHGVETELLVYEDELEGFHGYLAFAGQQSPLAAGGFRVQRGLRAETIESLAADMAHKERLLQLNVDGAKCGIDYDPRAPGKHEAMRRFLRFLRPHLESRLSLGPDMGTSFPEIEAIARSEGIPSVKAAIGKAQGLSEEEVLRRLRVMQQPVGDLTLGERRAGHALAYATLMALQRVTARGSSPAVAIQGFGTLARGCALSLAEAGVRVMAISDEFGAAMCKRQRGFNVQKLVSSPRGTAVQGCCGDVAHRRDRSEIFEAPVDALVLAACEEGIKRTDVPRLRARAVVVGANDGLALDVETALGNRWVLVVPDFVGGAGGSAAMDALFGPADCPDPDSVLSIVELGMSAMVDEVLDTAQAEGLTPRHAAYAMSERYRWAVGGKPYGLRLLVRPAKDRRRVPRDEPGRLESPA